MLNNLTRLKVLLAIIFVALFFMKRDMILEYFFETKQVTHNTDSVVILPHNDKDKDDYNENNPKIAIAVLNLGLVKNTLNSALDLDSQVILGFSSYADNLSMILQESTKNKHESMVLLPTQLLDYTSYDPGPHAIFVNNSITESTRKFSDILSKLVSNDSGIYIPINSALPLREDKALILLKLLEDHDAKFKFFMYYDPENTNFITKLITKSHIAKKTVVIDSIIDESLTTDDIIASLDKLVAVAKKNKTVSVGVISPTRISIETLGHWLAAHTGKVDIVPITEIFKERSKK